MRGRLLLVVVCLLGVSAGAAQATVRPVRQADGPLLARKATYEEKVAEAVAARLTRKHVNVRCGPLGVSGAGFPVGVTGITLFLLSGPAGYAVLLPDVCDELLAFRAHPDAFDPDVCGTDAGCLYSVAKAALAIATVTHESYHLLGYVNEAKVECYGMQSIWYAATKLGASVELGEALARFYAANIYAHRRTDTPEYWTPECRDGGKYDLRKDSGSWPS